LQYRANAVPMSKEEKQRRVDLLAEMEVKFRESRTNIANTLKPPYATKKKTVSHRPAPALATSSSHVAMPAQLQPSAASFHAGLGLGGAGAAAAGLGGLDPNTAALLRAGGLNGAGGTDLAGYFASGGGGLPFGFGGFLGNSSVGMSSLYERQLYAQQLQNQMILESQLAAAQHNPFLSDPVSMMALRGQQQHHLLNGGAAGGFSMADFLRGAAASSTGIDSLAVNRPNGGNGSSPGFYSQGLSRGGDAPQLENLLAASSPAHIDEDRKRQLISSFYAEQANKRPRWA